MLQAILKGKLSRDQENMEDILTSNVFGQLSYLEPSQALLPLLGLAVDQRNSRPLEALPRFSAKVSYEFWPYWQEPNCISCEPDVVIRIDSSDGSRWIVLVEAKYKSGKSSEADVGDERPKDQLAREWHNLVSVAGRENRSAAIVYLTSHLAYPESEITASLSELASKGLVKLSSPPLLLWLSWRHIPAAFASSTHRILRDIQKLMVRLNLRWYDGVRFTLPEPLKWRFNPMRSRWCRNERLQSIGWRFVNE